jgi:AcrR family transcriptional regulator
MADLAEAAGVTKPVLYQHFRSKRALYSELLEEVSHLLVSEVEKAAATAVGPHAQVRAGFAAYFRFVDQRRSAFQLLFLGGSRHDRELTAAVDRLEAAMAGAIAPLIEAGIGPKQRRQLAMALVGMAEATGRRALIDPDLVGPDGLEAMSGRLAALAWSGLRGIRPEEER